MTDGDHTMGDGSIADAPRGKRTPPEAAWEAARADYLAGYSAPQVCRRHGVGLSAFRARAKAGGWRRADQAWTTPARIAAPLDPLDEGAALEEAVGGDLDQVDYRELSWVAHRRMMRAVLRGDAAAVLRWRRVEAVMDAEQAAIDEAGRLDDALAFARAEAADRAEYLAEGARVSAALNAMHAPDGSDGSNASHGSDALDGSDAILARP
ncbi:hypothetical protein ASG17_14260 [Brevundimonas sp. Leaf363]|uniref:hypothetical protein n=1 Tax=Brevundimonas sp. Leaf363 TaxID=1736353 RepID=UPI0006F2F496|nr:hypothetical protein [Brevundimonas sp. Leaf363]KQS53681.1 hypothetical protein ASG17_14260 [Brevundimonas sp. Leaf363]